MNTFQQALSDWLAQDGNTQTSLAAAIGKTQVAVRRYALGERFPDAETARLIDQMTGGAVPYETWCTDFLKRSGIAA